MTELIEGLEDIEEVDWQAAYEADIHVRGFVNTLVDLLLRRAQLQLCGSRSNCMAAKGGESDE